MAFLYPIVYAVIQASPQWLAPNIQSVGTPDQVPQDIMWTLVSHSPIFTNLTLLIFLYNLVSIFLPTMTFASHPPGIMDVDGIIDNHANISTKVCEKTVDIRNQLPDEELQLATTAYTGLFGR